MIKKLYNTFKENFTEIWLGTLLFVGLPIIGLLYLDWRAFLAITVVTQTIILVLSTYKDSK